MGTATGARGTCHADVGPGSSTRRHLLRAIAAGGLIATGAPIYAKPQTARRHRIGYFNGAGVNNDQLTQVFEAELAKLGHCDGDNLIIERRRPRANTDELLVHAGELATLDLDLVAAGSLPFALAIRDVAPAMPMVIGVCSGMIGNGFANSLRRPGGIATGTDELRPGLTAKRLALLKQVVPGMRRVALLSTTPGRGGHEAQLADAERAAPGLGFSVKVYRAADLAELEAALAAIAVDGMEGMVSFQGGLALANRKIITAFAREHRLPAIYQSSWFVEAGGLMSWSYDLEDAFRHQARCVDRVLRGTRPGDIPIRYPNAYYLSVNQAAATALGLTVPPGLLANARITAA